MKHRFQPGDHVIEIPAVRIVEQVAELQGVDSIRLAGKKYFDMAAIYELRTPTIKLPLTEKQLNERISELMDGLPYKPKDKSKRRKRKCQRKKTS